MDDNVVFYSIIAMTGVFISAISQVMLKKAAMVRRDSRLEEYLNPLVIGAYILFVGTTFIAIYAYKGLPLSFGSILEATGYIYITFFGVKFFGEKISVKRIIAIGLIITGIIIYACLG